LLHLKTPFPDERFTYFFRIRKKTHFFSAAQWMTALIWPPANNNEPVKYSQIKSTTTPPSAP